MSTSAQPDTSPPVRYSAHAASATGSLRSLATHRGSGGLPANGAHLRGPEASVDGWTVRLACESAPLAGGLEEGVRAGTCALPEVIPKPAAVPQLDARFSGAVRRNAGTSCDRLPAALRSAVRALQRLYAPSFIRSSCARRTRLHTGANTRQGC